jgi:hypothetical protein
MTTTMIPALPTAPPPVTNDQANAWVGMAQQKNNLVFELGKQELAAQGLLLRLGQDAAYEAIDVALAAYRKAHSDMVEYRKPFTNAVNTGIIEPLMAFEKRVDPKTNPAYVELSNRSLSLRKAESDKVALQNAKNSEIANFKVHVSNEFSRVVTEYRQLIRREFTAHYNRCLTDKSPDPMIDRVKEYLKEIMPPAVAKFNAKYLSNEELLNIYNEVTKPDYPTYYADLMQELDQLFSNYSSDMANAEAAMKHQAQQAELLRIEEENKAKEEQAMNTLITTSETVVIEEPRIKKSVSVTVIESEQWAKAVMSQFIVNLPKMGKYFRVKKWSNLNIGQMATYLGQLATDEGVKFSGLELKEVEK